MRIKRWLAVLAVLAVSCGAIAGDKDASPFDPRPLMAKLREANNGGDTDKMHFLVFGDSKHSKRFPELLRYADTLDPQFCLTTGDLVSHGAGIKGSQEYERLETDVGWFMRKVATWPVVGNHELAGGNDGEANFIDFFGVGSARYSFEYGNAKFIALDWPPLGVDLEGLAWLRRELETGRGKHLFVFQHRPFYTVGSKSRAEVPGKPDAATELFEKHKVVAVFSGHDHIYYRTKRGGVNYVISAGAGASIYALDRVADAVEGDVYYGRLPGERRQYIYHGADGAEKQIDGQMHYFVSIRIDGPKVVLEMIDSTHKNEVWDRAVLVSGDAKGE